MGIKGRRKRLRERDARARSVAAHMEPDDDGSVVDGETDAPVGAGPFRLPVDAQGRLKIKKSDLFRLQDEEYLDRAREEHRDRKRGGVPRPDTDDEDGPSHKRQRSAASPHDDVALAAAAQQIADEYLLESTVPTGRGRTVRQQRQQQQQPRGASHRHSSGSGSTAHDNAEHRAVVERRELMDARRKAGHGAVFSHPLIGLDAAVVAALGAEGFLRMTLIQERTVPYAVEGYDLLGQARTGSGKTLAFCVPVLHLCRGTVQRHPHSTVALMLAPTKELCVQTHDVLKSVCQHIPASVAAFTVQLITGGTKVVEERKRLEAGPSVVVGTPGRVHDHVVHCRKWELSRLRVLVLDEADRMLADGFQRDLDAILGKLPRSRQTLLFSATNSKSVHELARLSLSHTPLFVDTVGAAPRSLAVPGAEFSHGLGAAAAQPLPMPPYRSFADPSHGHEDSTDAGGDGDSEERSSSPGDSDASLDGADAREDGEGDSIPSTLHQYCHIVALEDRLRSLYAFLKLVARRTKTMVFCSTVASATFHCQMMGSVGFHDDVAMLHGHMKHRQRVQTFQMFREWHTGVLFCTDVAARGLDIPHVEWILQYDPPLDPTEYIHRIGRTARAGSVGSALLFLAPEEANFIKYLSKFGIRLERYADMSAEKLPRIQENLEHVLQIDEVVAKSAVTAFRAHVGAYQSHILRETFDVHRLNLDRLAKSFALTSTPSVSLPKNAAEEQKKEYVKGKLKSLNRRKQEALRHYERFKVKPQWEDGHFIGVARPFT